MADKTINDLASLATPADNDLIGVWDVSAGQYVKVRRDAIVGAAIIGGGAINTNGKTLNMVADGTLALLEVSNTFQAANIMPALRTSGSNDLADDSALSFAVTTNLAGVSGLLILWSRFANAGNHACVVAFRASTSPYCTIVAQASNLVVGATGVLSGTTGTDGKLTIAAHTDGKIYIENRLGVAINFGYLVLG